MRNGCLILLSMLGSFGSFGSFGLLGCIGKRLHVGDDGAGGGHAGTGGGQAGASAGAAGSIMPSGAGGTGGALSQMGGRGGGGTNAGGVGGNTTGAGGTGGSGGATGTGGAAGQAGGGGAAGGSGLSVDPSTATFAGTLVEAVSAAQTFTVRNGSNATTALAALAGTNAPDFQITSNGCGTTLQPGASCDIAVAFAPKTRSGSRTASLTVGGPSDAAANASLSGNALPSLGLLAGALGGYGYADGTGAAARFTGPEQIASDGADNLYVADTGNDVIRKIVIATGAVTTLAGTPRQEGTADGIGAAARFSDLKGIASDGAGNLYVGDGTAIRKVVIATGAVTTLADEIGVPVRIGGTGGNGIDGMSGIASDGAGYLYVGDTDTSRGYLDATIRKVAIATGTVTTLADRTGVSVHFNGLSAIASDGAGNLYVAAGVGIEKVVIATGAVTMLAGGAGYGIATDGAGNLYFTQGRNTGNTIRKVVIATGAVTTLAGTAGLWGSDDGTGAAARFSSPEGIASDGAGNLYVADAYNSTIRKVVVATAAVTTFAGTAAHGGSADGTGAAARFYEPYDMASDQAGNLYIADNSNSTIRQLAIATGAVTTLAGTAGLWGSDDGTGATARFYRPSGIASDGAGNLYVVDAFNGAATIRKVVIATRAVTTLAGTAGESGSADGTGAAARFFYPFRIASDGAGNLYVVEAGNNTIRKVVIATRAVTTLAGTAGESGSADGTGAAARFSWPTGVASDGAGNLYVADAGNSTIRKVVIATGAVTTFAGAAGETGSVDGKGAAARFMWPGTIASDGAGNLYVADGAIRKVAIDSATVSTVIGSPGRAGVILGALPASLNGPLGIAVLPTGELAIADFFENSILIGHL